MLPIARMSVPDHNPQQSLRRLPSMTDLLKNAAVQKWMATEPPSLVTECLRKAVQEARDAMRGAGDDARIEPIIVRAEDLLQAASRHHIRSAVNATGVILHTGLGRAVFAESVVDAIQEELKGCCTLAVDVQTGERAERDELVEPLLTELTGAEASTVVNNNASGTLLALSALARGKEVIVSRGQLVEIGGSFRIPEVMAESQARLVETGSTNRTHLKDYRRAITSETVAIMRVHPSNYRVIGFTSEVSLPELAMLAHENQLLLIDDLGAGALIGLEQFGLPHEPTARESIEAGADLVLFSGDKLIGGSQAGIIAGKRELIQRIRSHPLMRAVRPDKTCLLVLERTLQLFRNPEQAGRSLPTYRMLCATIEEVLERGRRLLQNLQGIPRVSALSLDRCDAFLGSGSLPTQAISSACITISLKGMSSNEFLKRLRMDRACIFGRIEKDRVRLDLRTIRDDHVPLITSAIRRIAGSSTQE